MLIHILDFLVKTIATSFNWVFNLVINDSPRITLGVFLLSCAFIGIVIYFFCGTDFFPGHINFNSSKNNSNNNYQPKHSSGNTRSYSSNYSTRVGRNK